MINAKDISIHSYLAQRGVTPQKERGGAGLYLSPLRAERTPSFKVDYNKNVWYDFGIGKGGSIIDLVMQLDNCTVAEAYRKLEGSGTLVPIERPRYEPRHTESPIKILEVLPLRHPKLIEYITKDRAIDLEVARRYCREVHYTLNGKRRFAVGFQSDAGGWEFSSRGFKISSSPKAPTTLKGSSECTLLFEGFMDMLAYLTLQGSADIVDNLCVLNSVSNLGKAVEFLKTQRSIYSLMDNDTAGRNALTEVQKLGVEVVDMSDLYNGFKDVNDYLIARDIEPQQPRVKIKF